MMTTGKTFNTSTIQTPNQTFTEHRVLNEVAPPIASSAPAESVSLQSGNPDNMKLLNEWISKYSKGEITEEQLKVIKQTLGFNK